MHDDDQGIPRYRFQNRRGLARFAGDGEAAGAADVRFQVGDFPNTAGRTAAVDKDAHTGVGLEGPCQFLHVSVSFLGAVP